MQLTRGWRASRLGLFKKISTARRRSNWCIWGCSVMHTNGLESSIWRGPSGRSSSACSVRDLPVIQRHGLVFHSIKIRIVETLFFIFGNHFSLQYFRLTSLHSMKLHFLGPSWFSAFFRNAHLCFVSGAGSQRFPYWLYFSGTARPMAGQVQGRAGVGIIIISPLKVCYPVLFTVHI
jgi:hypothetical protein